MDFGYESIQPSLSLNESLDDNDINNLCQTYLSEEPSADTAGYQHNFSRISITSWRGEEVEEWARVVMQGQCDGHACQNVHFSRLRMITGRQLLSLSQQQLRDIVGDHWTLSLYHQLQALRDSQGHPSQPPQRNTDAMSSEPGHLDDDLAQYLPKKPSSSLGMGPPSAMGPPLTKGLPSAMGPPLTMEPSLAMGPPLATGPPSTQQESWDYVLEGNYKAFQSQPQFGADVFEYHKSCSQATGVIDDTQGPSLGKSTLEFQEPWFQPGEGALAPHRPWFQPDEGALEPQKSCFQLGEGATGVSFPRRLNTMVDEMQDLGLQDPCMPINREESQVSSGESTSGSDYGCDSLELSGNSMDLPRDSQNLPRDGLGQVSDDDLMKKIPSKTRKRERGPKVWEFLMRLLVNEKFNPEVIRWEDEASATFRLVQPTLVAHMWAARSTPKKSLCYNNFARSLRHHYSTGALKPVMEKQLVYRCGDCALKYLKHLQQQHDASSEAEESERRQ